MRFWLACMLFIGCGGADDVPPDDFPLDNFGLEPGRDYRATFKGPPEIRDHLFALSDDIAAGMCAYSERCCPLFDYYARPDCQRLADEVLLLPDFDWFVASGKSVQIDEDWTEACRREVARASQDCVGDPWRIEKVCQNAVQVSKSPKHYPCYEQDDCDILLGPDTHACVDGACEPIVAVGLQQACWADPTLTEAYQCAHEAYCDTYLDVCTARSAEGQACDDETCLDGLYCNADMQCQPLEPRGTTCSDDSECQAGMGCVFDGMDTWQCYPQREHGEACTDSSECSGLHLDDACPAGYCKELNFEAHFCAPPPIDEIPADKRLVELELREYRSLCHWSISLAAARLSCEGAAPDGLSVTCQQIPAGCEGTVGAFQECLRRVFADVDTCGITSTVLVQILSARVRATAACADACISQL